MKKYFNDTGSCFPEEHYMVDIVNKTNEIFRMIELGHYFVINRPRQYGKTTTLHTINNNLETQGLDNGYLIIFDFMKKIRKAYKQDRIASNQKNIFAVWV